MIVPQVWHRHMTGISVSTRLSLMQMVTAMVTTVTMNTLQMVSAMVTSTAQPEGKVTGCPMEKMPALARAVIRGEVFADEDVDITKELVTALMMRPASSWVG